MPRFFCSEFTDDTACLRGDDARHILRVLRMKPGEAITISDGNGNDYDCVIAFEAADALMLNILKQYPNQTEPELRVTLYQALPKGDKLESIVQKAVELGVYQIVPILTTRCVARPDAASFSKKRERYQKIATEAAKQCGRGIIPKVADILSLEEALKSIIGPAAVFYEGGGVRVRELLPAGASEFSILIGSEGGFSPEEIAACEVSGIRRATLGRRILRCETAPVAALALLHAAAGEM